MLKNRTIYAGIITVAFGAASIQVMAKDALTSGVNTGVNANAEISGQGMGSVNMNSDATGTGNTETNNVTGANVNGSLNSNNKVSGNSMWNEHDKYWSRSYNSRPYYRNSMTYNDLRPAYEFGVDSYSRYNGMRFNDLNEAELRREWEMRNRNSKLSWHQARDAIRDSYNRVYEDRNRM